MKKEKIDSQKINFNFFEQKNLYFWLMTSQYSKTRLQFYLKLEFLNESYQGFSNYKPTSV